VPERKTWARQIACRTGGGGRPIAKVEETRHKGNIPRRLLGARLRRGGFPEKPSKTGRRKKRKKRKEGSWAQGLQAAGGRHGPCCVVVGPRFLQKIIIQDMNGEVRKVPVTKKRHRQRKRLNTTTNRHSPPEWDDKGGYSVPPNCSIKRKTKPWDWRNGCRGTHPGWWDVVLFTAAPHTGPSDFFRKQETKRAADGWAKGKTSGGLREHCSVGQTTRPAGPKVGEKGEGAGGTAGHQPRAMSQEDMYAKNVHHEGIANKKRASKCPRGGGV